MSKKKAKLNFKHNYFEIIEDGEHILDTGGGIQNMIKDTNEKDFLILVKLIKKNTKIKIL